MYLLCVCMHAYVRVCVSVCAHTHTYTQMFNYTNIYVYMQIQSCTVAHIWGAEDNLKSVLSYREGLVLRISFRLPGLTARTLTL